MEEVWVAEGGESAFRLENPNNVIAAFSLGEFPKLYA